MNEYSCDAFLCELLMLYEYISHMALLALIHSWTTVVTMNDFNEINSAALCKSIKFVNEIILIIPLIALWTMLNYSSWYYNSTNLNSIYRNETNYIAHSSSWS